MDLKLETQRDMFLEVRRESQAQIQAIHDEMKDFHLRLLEIERNRRV